MALGPCTVESMVLNLFGGIYAGRRVLVTGHTGFKGGWLTLWLHQLGARVHGYALDPPTEPSLFESARVGAVLASDTRADLADREWMGRLADAGYRIAPPNPIFPRLELPESEGS